MANSYGPEYPNLHSHPVEYRVWSGIKQRCNNRSGQSYPNYGGRGIRVHEAWAESFQVFMQHLLDSIGPRPDKYHTFDRIDNDGNYEPGNVRWATWTQQAHNKRKLTFKRTTRPHVERDPRVEACEALKRLLRKSRSRQVWLDQVREAVMAVKVTNPAIAHEWLRIALAKARGEAPNA